MIRSHVQSEPWEQRTTEVRKTAQEEKNGNFWFSPRGKAP